MRTDFENIKDGERVILHPNSDNPLHKKPIKAHYHGGYFTCEGTKIGPDYYWRDVAIYNKGFETIIEAEQEKLARHNLVTALTALYLEAPSAVVDDIWGKVNAVLKILEDKAKHISTGEES